MDLRLIQRVRLAHFGRRNCCQLLSDVTGVPDISLPFILLYNCNNFIWSFWFFECIIIWIIFKKYAASLNNMTGAICAIPECKIRHGKHENFEVFLDSLNFSKIFLESFRSAYYSESSKILPKFFKMFLEIFWCISQDYMKYLSKYSAITLEMFQTFFLNIFKIILKNFDNISTFPKIFFEVFWNFPKYFSKFFKMIIEILRFNYQNFPIAKFSQ